MDGSGVADPPASPTSTRPGAERRHPTHDGRRPVAARPPAHESDVDPGPTGSDPSAPSDASPPPSSSSGVDADHGATSPGELGRREMTEVARRVQRDLVRHQTALLSAGIAFRAFLALFPALIVALTATALARPSAAIHYQARRVTIGLPEAGRRVILEQVTLVTNADAKGLRIAFVVSLFLAVWTAASALQGTMTALSTTQGEVDERPWLRQRAQALKLTAGAIPFVVVSVTIISAVPWVVRRVGYGSVAATIGVLVTLVVLAAMMLSALTVLYRHGPARRSAKVRWATWGAFLATGLWILGSQAFKLTVENVGTYDARYGAVAGVVTIMLWLWLTSWCVLLGATVNARLEHQTTVDSTVGPNRPMGERGAVPADTHPDDQLPLDVRDGDRRDDETST